LGQSLGLRVDAILIFLADAAIYGVAPRNSTQDRLVEFAPSSLNLLG
jgi:hypothetical protein